MAGKPLSVAMRVNHLDTSEAICGYKVFVALWLSSLVAWKQRQDKAFFGLVRFAFELENRALLCNGS